jgi:hypothetical protein
MIQWLYLTLRPEDGTHVPAATCPINSTCWKYCCVDRNIGHIIYSDLRNRKQQYMRPVYLTEMADSAHQNTAHSINQPNNTVQGFLTSNLLTKEFDIMTPNRTASVV